jgi:prepilin-type N-terminal cleavage/methylation domain-containing protein
MKTSIHPHRNPRFRGFTLIELIVTVSIIALLATLILVAMNHANTVAKRRKAETHLRVMSGYLDSYRADFGTYPRPKEGSENQSVTVSGTSYPAGGAVALYQALSGDGDAALEGGEVASKGEPGSLTESKVYWPELDPRQSTQRIVAQHNAMYMIVDPWGAPWRYRVPPRVDPRNPDEFEQYKTSYHNPATYDLSSYAGDYTNERAWIKNW